MKTFVSDPSPVSAAADRIAELLRERPEAVIALGANDDCLALYAELTERCRSGRLDLSRARFFAAGAFYGLPASDENSCRSRLRRALLRTADPTGERSFFLSDDLEFSYDEMIAEAGGLDLAILGIGERGRLVFNEPATPFDAVTHRQKLTKATRRELAPIFGAEEKVPEFGLTMGIHTLLGAKRILVIAQGSEKANPVFRMLYARTDTFVPAAFLQIPLAVELYLDSAAASEL